MRLKPCFPTTYVTTASIKILIGPRNYELLGLDIKIAAIVLLAKATTVRIVSISLRDGKPVNEVSPKLGEGYKSL